MVSGKSSGVNFGPGGTPPAANRRPQQAPHTTAITMPVNRIGRTPQRQRAARHRSSANALVRCARIAGREEPGEQEEGVMRKLWIHQNSPPARRGVGVAGDPSIARRATAIAACSRRRAAARTSARIEGVQAFGHGRTCGKQGTWRESSIHRGQCGPLTSDSLRGGNITTALAACLQLPDPAPKDRHERPPTRNPAAITARVCDPAAV